MEICKDTQRSVLTIVLDGRIDSNNAPQAEQEILSALSENPGLEPVFDAAALESISSAGLRVLMKARKAAGKPLRVENVSREVYEIFDVTGFTDLLDVKKALRELSVEGCEMIGRGGFGTVYRIDPETVVKVYREGVSLEQLEEEKRHATAAFVHGIPTAISFDTVKVGSCYGNVYELLDAVSVGKAVTADPSRAEELGRKMGRLFQQLHETEMEPGSLPRMSDKVRGWIDYLEEKHLSSEDAALMRQVADAIPEKNTLIHGDFHEGNVLLQKGELMLIDLDDVCMGNPVYDLVAHHALHRTTARDVAMLSLNLEPEMVPVLADYARREFLGTEDPAALERFCQTMELIYPFRVILYIAMAREASVMTEERVNIIKTHVLPVFRKLAPMMIQAMGQFR